MDIKVKASNFAKEFKLNSSRVLSFEELSKVAVKLNYKIFRPKNAESKVISALDLQTEFKELSAFSLAKGDVRYIFIRSDVPNEVAAALLLHELAHIYLGHLEKSTTPAASDEAEAKLFVSYVLKEAFGKRIRFTVLNGILCVLTSVMLAVTVHSSQRREPIAEVDTTTISAITSVTSAGTSVEQGESSEIVVVTKSGKKYHKPDCYHVVGSDVAELTIAEAEDAGYEPCKDCFPQSNE